MDSEEQAELRFLISRTETALVDKQHEAMQLAWDLKLLTKEARDSGVVLPPMGVFDSDDVSPSSVQEFLIKREIDGQVYRESEWCNSKPDIPEIEGRPVVVDGSPAPEDNCRAALNSQRKAMVNEYLAEVLAKTGKPIRRKDIWSQRYADSSEFVRWQSADPRLAKDAASALYFESVLRDKSHLK